MTQSVKDSEYVDVDVMEYNHVNLVQHVLQEYIHTYIHKLYLSSDFTRSDLLRWSLMRSEFQNTFRFEFIPNKAKQKRKNKSH